MSILSSIFKPGKEKGGSAAKKTSGEDGDWVLRAEEFPNDPLARHRAGEELARRGERAAAISQYLAAADLYLVQGFAVKALAVLGLASRLDPENDSVRTRIATIARDEDVPASQRGDITIRTRLRAWTPLFSDFSRADLTDIVAQMSVRRFEANEILMKEGQVADALSVLVDGTVWILTVDGQGQPIEIGRLRPGDFFGEASVLRDLPSPATLRAASAGELLTWPRAAFEEISAGRPELRDMLERFHEARAQRAVETVVARFRETA